MLLPTEVVKLIIEDFTYIRTPNRRDKIRPNRLLSSVVPCSSAYRLQAVAHDDRKIPLSIVRFPEAKSVVLSNNRRWRNLARHALFFAGLPLSTRMQPNLQTYT